MKFGRTHIAWAGATYLVWSCLLLLPIGMRAADAPVAKPIAIPKTKRSATVDFEREILPILKNNCIACHNQTKPKGGLVLETPQAIQKGGDSGPAAVPKKPADSLLLKAAAHEDPELIMPPPDNKVAATSLKPDELGLLRLWIEQGAAGEVRASLPVVWQPVPSGLKSIYAVALTRDGQFAACGRANQIFIYHLPTARLVARLNDPALQASRSGPGAHRDVVNSLAFSPDGQLLASGGYREVKLWRQAGPAEKFKFPPGTELVAASADGKWLAAATTNGELRVFDASGKRMAAVPARGPITVLKFAGSDRLAVSRGDSLDVVSIPDGTIVATAKMPAPITSVASGGPEQLVMACGDNVIRITGSATNDRVLAIVKELHSPTAVVLVDANVSATNQLIAASPDGTVRVWNLAEGRALKEMQHGSPITALVLRPDGKSFATAGGAAARLWRMNQTNAVAELKGDGRARFLVDENERELSFARAEIDFRKLALKSIETNRSAAMARHTKASDTNAALARIAAEKQVLLTNAVTARKEAEKAIDDLGPEIKKLVEAFFAAEQESTNAAALAKAAKDRPDKAKAEKLAGEAEAKARLLEEARANLDKLPAETNAKPKLVIDKLRAANKAVVDAEKEFQRAERTRSTSQNELELATDALQKADLAVASANDSLAGAQAELKKAESHWQAAKEALSKTERPIHAVAFAPDNSALMTADDRAVRSWSADIGAPMQSVKCAPDTKSIAALSATTVAVAGGAGVVWNMNPGWMYERSIGTGDARSPLADRINALRFTADGLQLFTGGGEPTRGGEIKLWRIRDGGLVRDFPNVHSDSVFALDLSADGKFLASGAADRFAKVIELDSGKVTRTLEGHLHHVLGIAWKRDGRTIVTAGADNVAKVWDATTGERRKNIEGFGKEVTAARFVGVGDEIVLSAGDGQVTLVKEKGDKIKSFAGANDYVYAAAVTADGTVVVAGGADGVLRAWNGRDGKLLVEFPNP